jgi:predicted metalloendopeptidase
MQTLCENTADQVGISLAFDALALTYQPSGNRTFVPDRDAEQFYLIFGQMWCSVYDQEAMCDRADDVHSLAHLRVRRTVAHQARFSEIHECLVGQAMHRVERCVFF